MKPNLEYHKIQPGETLSGIMTEYYGSTDRMGTVADINHLRTPNMIIAGNYLRLPLEGMKPEKRHVNNPQTPPKERLEAIMDLFQPGFCDIKMAYDIYAAATGTETQYYRIFCGGQPE